MNGIPGVPQRTDAAVGTSPASLAASGQLDSETKARVAPGRLRSGFANADNCDEHWMIKFDGTGDLEALSGLPNPTIGLSLGTLRWSGPPGSV